jgi:CHAT domain-containing protein
MSPLQDILQLMPRSHPRRRTLLHLSGEGCLLSLLCNESLVQNKDIDQAVLHLTEAILLPFRSLGILSVNTIKMLLHLASALLQRSKRFEQPDDANFAIKCLYYFRSQPLESSGIQQEVTTLLVEALAIRAVLGSSDGMQDIQAMIAICDEPFISNVSGTFAFRTAISIFKVISACGNGNGPILDQCINRLREARIRQPNSPILSIPLALALMYRFAEMLADDDVEEATTILDKILVSQGPGNSLDIDRWQHMSRAIMSALAGIRSAIYQKPEYVEEAMSHFRLILHSPSLSDEHRPETIELLDHVAGQRFSAFSVEDTSALQGALSVSPEIVGLSSLLCIDVPRGDIAELRSVKTPNSMEVDKSIRDLQERLLAISPGTSNYRRCLEKLVAFCRTKVKLTNDPADIETAIKCCRLLLDSTPPGGVSSCKVAISLSDLLKLAFHCTNKIENLDESIGLLIGVLKVPAGQVFYDKGTVVGTLISSIFKRAAFLNKQDTRDSEAMVQVMEETMQTVNEIFQLAADNKYISVPMRLRYSCRWAEILRQCSPLGIGVSTIPTAYEKAMSLLQESVMFAPTLQLQHSHLVGMLQVTEKMPSDYASHLVHTGQLTQAIETLERGRALLWSELRGLRSSIRHISGVDPLLAEKLTAINQGLEKLTMSVLSSRGTEANGDGTGDGEGPDPFGRLLVEQRKLLEERNNVISQIRSSPSLRNFLMAPTFDTLRSAASHGPVIIINHSEWGSDILILLCDSPPSLLPTSKSFYDDGARLRENLIEARRKRGLDSREYERTLASVLENLYNLVGQPVIDRLHELDIPEQSRVWWCPTSVFCSLPLHAMGPIPSNDGVKRYFSDLYIPSYTSTLSALIESRNTGPELQTSKRPSLLLVAQPDRSLPGVKGEIKVIQQLGIEVESLILKDATTVAVLEGLRRHELVHFACHCDLKIGKPFDASFKLYRDERLKLLDIVHSRLPTAEFAFLSACNTAGLTEESISDEGLHLTAAVQYCGFRSVVGTMWAMADIDGRDLARRVYQSILSGKDESPYYLRSATALRDAVRQLRNNRGVSLERWVNFVHYGA